MSKKHGSTHHLAPQSQGGPDTDWNKKDEKTKRHRDWHTLFKNWFPCVAIYVIENRWIVKSRYLNKKRLSKKRKKSWERLFGNILPKNAIKIIEEEWTIKDQWNFKGCFGHKACFKHNDPGNPRKICPIIEMYKKGELI